MSVASDVALLEQLRNMPPQFDADFVQELERILDSADGDRRRAALLILTNPGTKLLDDVKENRGFAVAVADVHSSIPGMQKRLRSLCDFLETSSAWMLLALAQRPDMDQVIAEAEEQES